MTPISLTLREPAGIARVQEVATLSVPLPRGLAAPGDAWQVETAGENATACQTSAVAAWPDGSVRWLRVVFPATVTARERIEYRLSRHSAASAMPESGLKVAETADWIDVQTGTCSFRLPRRGDRWLEQVQVGKQPALGPDGAQLRLVDRQGQALPARIESLKLAEAGPLLVRIVFTGRISQAGLLVRGDWTFRANSASAQLDLTIHNPSRARHHRGLWDLGDPGSVLFRSLTLEVPLAAAQAAQVQWCEQLAGPWNQQPGGQFEIVQQTSVGPHDASRNHVNRLGELVQRESGYLVRSATGERRGARAEPIVAVHNGETLATAGMAEFWQQFPKALKAESASLQLGIFPEQSGELHELQGGEQKTTRMAVAFGTSAEPAAAPLLAALAPLEAACDPAWMAASGAVWRLPQSQSKLRPEWHTIAEQALVGTSSFFAKRETADEYGWRNFGDLWADHEEAYYDGPRPIVSHYNNQYDPLEAFLLCYLLTGDRRWWELADPLARHIIDIDIYRTTQDRAAYNGGLFWHTNHYVEAATATHRSYSKVNHPAGGGGPANEHNYTSGLLLYFHLTGNEQARDTVVGLADWVLQMDDGRRHLQGLVSEAATGFASKTSEINYHGPGRGAGNSLNALLDGWLASGRKEFLVKAEELVRRTIHPHDDIASLELNKAELRWSYTVFLQSLVRLLAMADECGLNAYLVEYARASLLHYARWMAQHESFYLDQPEQLEYPTETWAAQELRKANVLTAAAQFADAIEAAQFRAKAEWFYDRAWSSLMSFPTWQYTRPTVLALQMGLSAAQLASAALPEVFSKPSYDHSVTPRSRFVPQRERVRRSLRSPAELLAMTVRLARVWRWPQALGATWTGHQVRRFWGNFVG
ncbi:MAG: hypothetical protein WD872_06900 [Pirellulaceae bacterium]